MKNFMVFERDKLLTNFFIFFFFYIALEGMIRYLFIISNLSIGMYFIKILMLVMIAVKIYSKVNVATFLASSVVAIYFINGVMINGLDRALVSLFIFVLLFFCMIFPVKKYIDSISITTFMALLLLLFLGLVMNLIYEFPWEGVVGYVNGIEIESSKLWWTEGRQRLAGFGRSSFEVAIYSAFLCLIIIEKSSSKKELLIVSIIAVVSVYLTTSKGTMAALIFTLLYLFCRGRNQLVGILIFYVSILIGNVVLLMSAFDINTDFLFRNFFSLFERLQFMWPYAFDRIDESSNILGLGFGGVGVAAAKNHEAWAAIDNFWLYIISMFGFIAWGGLLFFILSFGRYLALGKNASLYVFFFVNGVTTNMIEAGLGQVILAIMFVELAGLGRRFIAK